MGNADPRALLVASAADATAAARGDARGHLRPGAGVHLPGERPQVEREHRAPGTRAKELIEAHGALPVPMKLRNATTRLMKEEGYGEGYKYAHDFEGGVVPGETYLPDELAGQMLYEPTDRGEEQRIKERLARLRQRRSSAGQRRSAQSAQSSLELRRRVLRRPSSAPPRCRWRATRARRRRGPSSRASGRT